MPKIPMAPPPNPPKKIKTFQDFVKKVEKTLDKPTKTVYNILKDVREVQDLWSKYIYNDKRYELNGKHGYHDKLQVVILHRAERVNELCTGHNIPLPTLAGGAIRDLFWNKLPKDYDFFFNCNNEEEAYELIDNLTTAMQQHGGYSEGGPDNERYGGQNEGEDNFEGVYGVFNWGPQCQLIVGVWPDCQHIYDRFDLSVCQAEMDIVTKEITVSQDFLDTIVTKQIKNYRPTSQYSQQREATISNNLQLPINKTKTGARNEDALIEEFKIKWFTMPFNNVQQQ